MPEELDVQPLSLTRRRYTFFLLVFLFVLALPLLYLYAIGYRFDFGKETPFVSTGGIYVAAERTGAEIYIDDQLVRETRTFRKAFYAQGLEPGVHRVYVQKLGHHTWVKELPVYPYLVTEAQAFNLPVIPSVRVMSVWKTALGETVLTSSSTIAASTTNAVVVAPRTLPTFVKDTEYATLVGLFTANATTTTPSTGGRITKEVGALFGGTSTSTAATTTKEINGVRLFESEGNIYAKWVGTREGMPYYYCAKDFELSPEGAIQAAKEQQSQKTKDDAVLIGPVQSIPANVTCDPTIEIDREGEAVRSFDFYPGSTDFVIIARDSGVYMTEIDNRAWQNTQPLLLGTGLDVRVQNGNIYVYDGTLIYQILIAN